MLSDLERTKQHFESLGYREVPKPVLGHHQLGSRQYYHEDSDGLQQVILHFGSGDHGYGGFGFCLVFSELGHFLGHGAYE